MNMATPKKQQQTPQQHPQRGYPETVNGGAVKLIVNVYTPIATNSKKQTAEDIAKLVKEAGNECVKVNGDQPLLCTSASGKTAPCLNVKEWMKDSDASVEKWSRPKRKASILTLAPEAHL